MKQVNIHEAKTHLSRLVRLAASGEEILIARAGEPVARLTGREEARRPRHPGALRGKIQVSEDFDAPDASSGEMFMTAPLFLSSAPARRKRR